MPNNSTAVLVDRFYPTLATVVNEDEIPEILGFLKEGIVFLFDKIHVEECGLFMVIIIVTIFYTKLSINIESLKS